MVWPAIISAVASMASAYGANQNNNNTNKRSMNYNAQQAFLQRAWEEKMSNTAYQRQVADLKKARLNPALGMANGGASTPGGAEATAGAVQGAQQADIASPVSAIGKWAQKKLTEKEIENATKTGENIDAQTDKARAEANEARAREKAVSDSNKRENENQPDQQALLRSQANAAETSAMANMQNYNINKPTEKIMNGKYGTYIAGAKMGGEIVNSYIPTLKMTRMTDARTVNNFKSYHNKY